MEVGPSESHKIGKVAAHVPDLVVFGDLSGELPYTQNFHGVLLFADVSGFTALTEKFSMASKKGYGADQLTKTLNGYIGEIVDHVLLSGGDILNFAGDALLALWNVERKEISDVITLAAKCSLDIQKDCGVRNTEVGVELRVKIGISAGRITKVVVGSQHQEFFVVIGRAVDEVRLAEGLAEASTIILSPNAWELCDRTVIVSEKIENERAVKLRQILKNPEFELDEYLKSYGNHLEYEKAEQVNTRRASQLKPNDTLETTLRKYVMATVLQKIDDDQPLEYLSEMRPVTILFLNLQFTESATIQHQCQAMQDCSNVITKLIRRYNGRINKVFMFDKGCTFLCIFGLPGDKLEDECTHALRSAFKIHTFCTEHLVQIRTVSIGVTNGPVFCGVVGHALRHEYTVIGRKVNLAARMMMHYPGLVTCDEETVSDSKLPPYFFNELPKKAMKGVKNPGIIYEYLGDKENSVIGKSRFVMERDLRYPLLGREKEIELYTNTINNFFSYFYDDWLTIPRAVIFEGPPGFGKSRLLAEINFLAQRVGHRVVAMELAKLNIRQPFYTIQTMMAMYLRIDVCKTYTEREKTIESKMFGPEYEELLCLLNNLFFVKFPISQRVSLMDQEQKQKELQTFLMTIVEKDALEDEPLVLIIDQAHYIDIASWNFLAELFVTHPVFFIMTLGPYRHERPPCEAALKLMKSEYTVYVVLKALKPSVIPDLACQTLGVASIPTELEMLLIERSYGIPYYCEELLKSMYVNKIIIMEPLEEDDENDRELLLTKSMSVTASQAWRKRGERKGSIAKWQVLNPRKVMSLSGDRSEEHTIFVCILTDAVKLQNMPLPFTLKGIALAQLDHMSTSEQMVVKCASVIGQTFLFNLLHYILPERSQKKIVQTIMSLVKSRILECASPRPENSSDQGKKGFCFCPEGDSESDLQIHNAAFFGWPCKIMRFCTPLLQETAYELWLKEQVTELHFKCAEYLDKDAEKCSSCGGGDFIYWHRNAVDYAASLYDLPSQEDISIVEGELEVTEHASQLSDEGHRPHTDLKHGPKSQETFRKRLGSKKKQEASKKATDYMSETNLKFCPEETEGVPDEACIRRSDFEKYKRMQKLKISRIRTTSTIKFIPTGKISEQNIEDPRTEYDFLAQLDRVLEEQKRKHFTKPKSCSCMYIRDSVIAALARHWLGYGDLARTIYFLLETAAAALYLSNNYKALSYVNEAEYTIDMVKNKKRKPELLDITKEKVEIPDFEIACLYRLKGEVLFNMGNVVEARDLLKKALGLLSRSFPFNTVSVLFKLVIEKAMYSMYERRRLNPRKQLFVDEAKIPFLYEQINCLSLLWKIFCMNARVEGKMRALLAVIMEVNSAEQTGSEDKLIMAYMDCVVCCQMLGFKDRCKKFEMMVIQHTVFLPETNEGLLVMAQLTQSMANTKLVFGELNMAVEFGYRSHNFAALLNNSALDILVLPITFEALFLQQRYEESIAIVRLLDEIIMKNPTIIAQAWFYTICLEILLQGGFAYKSFEDCFDFVDKNHSNSILVSENRLMLSLFSSLALWFARLEDWDLFRPAYRRARKLVMHTNASYLAIFGYAKFLECQALLLRKVMIDKIGDVEDIEESTFQHMEKFMSLCVTAPLFYDRALHMKAFILMLTGKDLAAMVVLQKALESCKKHMNKLEETWIKLSSDLWFDGDTSIMDLWMTASVDMPEWEEASQMDMDTLYRTKFLLQLPLHIGEQMEENSSVSLFGRSKSLESTTGSRLK